METMHRVVVYSHYDRDNIIDDYSVEQIKELSTVASVIFVSTSSLPSVEEQKISVYTKKIICRENVGYDFLSYRIGYEEALNLGLEIDELVLCNDSVYGPFTPLAPFFSRAEPIHCDFWGVTSSRINGWHLQSYFLVFRKQVLVSDFFKRFMKSITILNDKASIIQEYEIGISQILITKGFKPFCIGSDSYLQRFRILADFLFLSSSRLSTRLKKVLKYAIRFFVTKKYNHSLTHWKYLIKNGIPFLKIELVRINAGDLATLSDIKPFIPDHWYGIISKHLDRTAAGYHSAKKSIKN